MKKDPVDFVWSQIAAELAAAGLPDLAAKAARGDYDHFRSTLDLDRPCVQLFDDLWAAGTPEAGALWGRFISLTSGRDPNADGIDRDDEGNPVGVPDDDPP